MTIVVTGATGPFGRHAIETLLRNGTPASEIVGVGRQIEKIADLGVATRRVDYDDPESLRAAFEGADRVLFVSASEAGKRLEQHRNVVEAAKAAGVSLIVYTSIVKADTSDLLLAAEHQATEQMLIDSGLPYVFLRNSWYLENYDIAAALDRGLVGASGHGKISAATRFDLAEAAAAVVAGEGHERQVYELGGEPFTLPELAAVISRESGREVSYTDLPEEKYTEVLVGAGLPEGFAAVLADSDRGAAKGYLHAEGDDLARLLGRPVTPLVSYVRGRLA
jgi:NAD(P)H dehydrogenase (quinone)